MVYLNNRFTLKKKKKKKGLSAAGMKLVVHSIAKSSQLAYFNKEGENYSDKTE